MTKETDNVVLKSLRHTRGDIAVLRERAELRRVDELEHAK
jgi:hypothetical protein